VPRLFELPTALLEYLTGLQSPTFWGCYTYMIVIMKYTIYRTALLLIIAGEPSIETIAPRAPLAYLSSEKKALRHQLCTTCYAVIQINNYLNRTFVIKVATMKITDDLMEAITCLPLNRHFSWWTKMNGTQRRAMLSPWKMYVCTAVW